MKVLTKLLYFKYKALNGCSKLNRQIDWRYDMQTTAFDISLFVRHLVYFNVNVFAFICHSAYFETDMANGKLNHERKYPTIAYRASCSHFLLCIIIMCVFCMFDEWLRTPNSRRKITTDTNNCSAQSTNTPLSANDHLKR